MAENEQTVTPAAKEEEAERCAVLHDYAAKPEEPPAELIQDYSLD